MSRHHLPLLFLAASLAVAVPRPATAEIDVSQALDSLRLEIRRLEQELRALKEGGGGKPAPEPADAPGLLELQRRIEVLTREIERLRGGETPVEANESQHGFGPAASKVYGVGRGVSIGGYGELVYDKPGARREDGTASGRKDRLDLLRAVLYTGYKFNDRALVNTEIEFEHATTGEGAEEKGEVSVEFAYLDFLLRPTFNLRAGLLLMPMGFINELHEPTTYLGTHRPETERAILPSTWREAGLGIFGDSGPWSWRAYLVNGLRASGFAPSGLRDGRQSGSKAVAENFAVTGRLEYRPRPGITLGTSLFTGNADQGEVAPGVARTIFEVHAEVRERGLEARALYAQAAVGDAGALNRVLELPADGGVASRLAGGYIQVGYDLLSLGRVREAALVPYLRWERVNTQSRMPAGFTANPAADARYVTFGVAWRPLPQIVVKADWTDASNEAATGVDQFGMQLGWVF